MDMSVPYNPAVVNLSLSDPNCINAGDECTAYYAAQNASQAAVSWAYQFEYGHWVTYYYVISKGCHLNYSPEREPQFRSFINSLIVVGILFLAYIFTMAIDTLRKGLQVVPQRPSFLRKLQAIGRYVFYRRIRASWPAKLLDFPTDIGTILFLLVTMVFLTALVFAVKPYYREQIGYGSPPIAIRSGLMAFACVPILVALSGKVNTLTFLTGISHEKLNILHRWVAWMSFALSLLHALPFFIGSARNPIVGGEAMVKTQFYMYGTSGSNEYTGVPPLAILFGMCILSLPYIRNRFYESFYAAHILLAITYFGLLFWHSANTLDSWAYLWATLAIWLTSWLVRIFWKNQSLNVRNFWLNNERAILTVVPGDVTRVDIWLSGIFHWKPSQHVFLRFNDIAPLDNHPFTIATAESATSSGSHLVFLPRAHAGFTRKLFSYAQDHTLMEDKAVTTSVWLDGPYGGLRHSLHHRYDTLILIAGGTGITACFSWLQDVVSGIRKQDSVYRIKRVVLVWAMKAPDAVQWLADEFRSLTETKERVNKVTLEIRVHITGGKRMANNGDSNQPYASYGPTAKKGDPNVDATPIDENTIPPSPLSYVTDLGATVHTGRPNMSSVLDDFVRQGERAMVIGCGPDTFRADLGNAAAAAQIRILKGQIVELAMHLETFGW